MIIKKFMFAFFVVICTFLVGCEVQPTEESDSVPLMDMNTSREGILSSGRRFVFFGADQMYLTFEQFLTERNFVYRFSYDFLVHEETIEEILERPEFQYGVSPRSNPDGVVVNAYYFSESSNVLFIILPVGDTLFLGFPSAIVVNHETGVASHYAFDVWRD
jgi:hypothetical protein